MAELIRTENPIATLRLIIMVCSNGLLLNFTDGGWYLDQRGTVNGYAEDLFDQADEFIFAFLGGECFGNLGSEKCVESILTLFTVTEYIGNTSDAADEF